LSGSLHGVWVTELRSNWDEIRSDACGRKCVIDLREVISVDKGGQQLLAELKDEGAQFVATGVYLKHVLQEIASKRSRRRSVENGIQLPKTN
jgi:ABC-type transporter Mla MlaB component